MRFRVTVRDLNIELRGYIDGEDVLRTVADDMRPTAVVASPAPENWDPFAISEPNNPPDPDKSRELIETWYEQFSNIHEFFDHIAYVHYHQALVIRGERYQREQAEAELRDRELHHFEVEAENVALKARLEGK